MRLFEKNQLVTLKAKSRRGKNNIQRLGEGDWKVVYADDNHIRPCHIFVMKGVYGIWVDTHTDKNYDIAK